MIAYAVTTPPDAAVSPMAEKWLEEIVNTALTIRLTPTQAADAFAETLRQVELLESTNWVPQPLTDLCPDVIEHADCQSTDCERVICPTGPCSDHAELGCSHNHHMLCDEHWTDCIECVRDARADGGAGR